MTISNRYAYACATYRERGICSSKLRVPRESAERAILSGIRETLMSDDAFQRFTRAMRAELSRRTPSVDGAKRKLVDAERIRDNVLAAIRAGIISPSVKAELEASENAVASAKREIEESQGVDTATVAAARP